MFMFQRENLFGHKPAQGPPQSFDSFKYRRFHRHLQLN